MELNLKVPGGESPYLAVIYAFVAVILACIVFFFYESEIHPGIPVLTPSEAGDAKSFGARPDLYIHGKELVTWGLKKFPSCFQLATAQGTRIILPNRFVDEVRNHPHLDFNKAIAGDFFSSYPGFEPFYDEGDFTASIVRTKLTQSLNHITDDLAEETVTTFREIFTDSTEWTGIPLKSKLLDLVSRISARVFIGPELCTNNEWLEITKKYTMDSFVAAQVLRSWPAFTRPIVHWFLPECRKIRQEIKDARRILKPVLEERRERNRKAREAGEPPAKVADAVGWMDDAAKGYGYDAAVAQIGLALAAIHTTTMSLCGIFFDLMTHPEYIEPLRDEIRTVLAQDGWKKTSLFQLRLMDSLMKESQRHHMPDFASMHRIAEDSIKLSDGTTIPKGARTMVTTEMMRDPSIFPAPYSFNGKRYLEMRQQPGSENRWQFVTTSPEHLIFGHGKHACPGRFFASNEIKIALSHLLMMYDWKMPGVGDAHLAEDFDANPEATIMMRRRRENMACFAL